MKHYQVCFTRVGGQGSGDGWQSVNASGDLPPEAIASFTRIQNANVYPPEFDEEDMREQTVYELQHDLNYAFLTHIKYGLKDQTGRPSMFAHSFVFGLSDFVSSPADVLNVDRSNFGFDAERTANAPDTLARADGEPLMASMYRAQMVPARYAAFIQCVYFILDSKAKKPLHIICDCEADTVRRLLVCVFSALPFEFRKKVSFSTCENHSGQTRTIIFERRIKGNGGYYFVPKTGENNVLSDAVAKRWEKYEFMTAVPRNVSGNPEDYFRALEEKLSLLGSAQTASFDLYKIAHDLCEEERDNAPILSDDALSRRLNEYLSVPVSHPYLDRLIKHLLDDITLKNITLNDVVSEKLTKKLENTEDRDLIESGCRYSGGRLTRMPAEDAVNSLYSVHTGGDAASFARIKEALLSDEKGQAVLSGFYVRLAAGMKNPSKENIAEFYTQTKALADRGVVLGSLSRLCLECMGPVVKAAAKSASSPKRLLGDASDLFSNVLRERPDMITENMASVKQEYWDGFDFSSFRFGKGGDYDGARLTGNRNFMLAEQLLRCYRFFADGQFEAFQKSADELLAADGVPFSPKERGALISSLQSACLAEFEDKRQPEFDVWLTLAYLGTANGVSPAEFLIDNGLWFFAGNFEEAYASSRFFKDEDNRRSFMDLLNQYAQSKQKGYRMASEILREMREFEKRRKKGADSLGPDEGEPPVKKQTIFDKLFRKDRNDD